MNSEMTMNKKNNILSLLSGTILSVCVTLILILAFAFIIKITNLSDNLIFPINQVIKIISIFVGVLLTLRISKDKGFLKGILIGITYYILSFIVFSILQGDFSITMNNIYDLLLTSFMGGLIGIIVVNIRK
jgi:putative membrane protein (TIGR04086 family)